MKNKNNSAKIPFFAHAQRLLNLTCPQAKTASVFDFYWAYQQGLVYFENVYNPQKACLAGRPELPKLVEPGLCASRNLNTPEGRLGLIHALAHIEFNAINLALDACCRFTDMPRAYYEDWLRVAKEEAYHFNLLKTHLNALGKQYGDFPAHNGLWEMAQKTAHCRLARMGCVPRLLEARGLDVGPVVAQKIKPYDPNAASLLEIIMRDEETHVRIGNRWFRYLCKEQGLDPLMTFKLLVAQHAPNTLKPPLAKEARLRAGFEQEEVDWIESVF